MSCILVSHPAPNITKITLNRPERLNAINTTLLQELTTALRTHVDSRVIILEGAGDRAFCAGEDLKETLAPQTGSAAELRTAFSHLQDITRLTACSSALVVSAVKGYAVGGGAEIALAADFVVGRPDTQFKFPEVTLGHAVTGGISQRLAQMVGLLKAKELLIRGRFVMAQEALAIGLLSEIANDPSARAEELALELAELPEAAAASLKMSLERAVFPNMEIALHEEVNAASYCFAQTEAADAFRKFGQRKTNTAAEASGSAVRDINTSMANAVNRHPDKVFLRFQGESVTFGAFHRSVTALASGLRQEGVQPGDRVLIFMNNSIEMVHSWFAVNHLGAIWVPMNTEWRSITLKHAVKAAEAKLAIVDDDLVDVIRSTSVFGEEAIWIKGGSGSQNLLQLYDHDSRIIDATPVTQSAISAFLYTSGTTGKSKSCMLSHEYFVIQASILIDTYSLRADDVLYCPFPLFHADATALTVIPALLLGATAALSPRFSASQFWNEIRETRATVYDFMGATLALIYKQPPSPRDQDHHVRLAWGVPIPAFVQDYEKRFGHPLYTLYGSTEASIPIVQQGPRVPGSCGTLRPGYQLRISNGEGEPLPPNTPGQLLLRSDNPNAFFQGYFNDAINTAKTYAGMWLHTGDIAKVDKQGNVFFLGRMKDVIRRRGENISASEVEEEFLLHPDVMMVAAFAVPSQLGSGTEDELKVAVKLRGGSRTNEDTLWHWAKNHMSRFQVPSVIEIVTGIKTTPTGKIDKGSLKTEGGRMFYDHRSRL